MPASARPTSGRARQALFDLLRGEAEDARVLDLYAGSGAVGLEAVSRGAASAVLVEADARELVRTLARWGIAGDEVRVLAETAARAITRLCAEGARFDLVFADPPYSHEPHGAELARVRGLLEEDALLVLQADAGAPAPAIPGLVWRSSRAYGRNVFHFFGIL